MSRRDVKNILLENRYFIKLRYSALFLKLWSFLRPSWKKELLHQRVYYHQFFTQLKPGKHIAFDIGANEGFITQLFLQFGVFVVAAEPDKRNVAILSRRFKARKRFQLFPGAIGENNEKHPFFLQDGGTAFSTISHKWKEIIELGSYRFHSTYNQRPQMVETITLDKLIDTSGMPSFIKIDVEGYEAEVMKGLNSKVPILVFEANLPQFAIETLACLKKLHEIDERAIFNYSASFAFASGNFSTYHDFVKILSSISQPCIDIICIMSNYFEYYLKLPGGDQRLVI